MNSLLPCPQQQKTPPRQQQPPNLSMNVNGCTNSNWNVDSVSADVDFGNEKIVKETSESDGVKNRRDSHGQTKCLILPLGVDLPLVFVADKSLRHPSLLQPLSYLINKLAVFFVDEKLEREEKDQMILKKEMQENTNRKGILNAHHQAIYSMPLKYWFRFRSERCRDWVSNGRTCPRGKKCWFFHEDGGVRLDWDEIGNITTLKDFPADHLIYKCSSNPLSPTSPVSPVSHSFSQTSVQRVNLSSNSPPSLNEYDSAWSTCSNSPCPRNMDCCKRKENEIVEEGRVGEERKSVVETEKVWMCSFGCEAACEEKECGKKSVESRCRHCTLFYITLMNATGKSLTQLVSSLHPSVSSLQSSLSPPVPVSSSPTPPVHALASSSFIASHSSCFPLPPPLNNIPSVNAPFLDERLFCRLDEYARLPVFVSL